MARLFKIGFDRIWGQKSDTPTSKELEVESTTPGDSSTVAASNAEVAIRKLREREVGYFDEDEDQYIIEIVIHWVENLGPLDIA